MKLRWRVRYRKGGSDYYSFVEYEGADLHTSADVLPLFERDYPAAEIVAIIAT